MTRKLNNRNFITIADWMLNDFDLNTNELICYAIIYGFSQDGESVFSGSLNYLSSWLCIRRDNVLRYLNSLVDKGLITKEKKSSASKVWCEYKITSNKGDARNSDHIIILPWMVEVLNLKGKELILYALIHGFSRTGSNSYFSGNNSYMSKWLGIDKSNVKRYTSALLNKNLIEKIEDSKYIKYRAIIPNCPGCTHNDPGQIEYIMVNNNKNAGQNEYNISHIEYNDGQNEYIPIVNMSTNNISNKLNNNTNLNNNQSVVEQINNNIDSSDFNESETMMLSVKISKDLKVLEKYCDKGIDIVKFMSFYADYKFRNECIYKYDLPKTSYLEDEDPTDKAEELLFNTLTLKRFKDDLNIINSFSKEEVLSLFEEALLLFDHQDEAKKTIFKTKEAYFIGIVENFINLKK